MNIYVSTSDKSIHVIEAFQYTFNKYWSDEQIVIILGYKAPKFKLNKNFKFVSLGDDTGPNIGTDLINYFNTVNDDEFIYALDDFPIISPIDSGMYNLMLWYLNQIPNIGRIGLTADIVNKSHSRFNKVPTEGIINLDQSADYRMSATWSIWRKEYFLKYLEPGMNLWDWEIKGSELAKNDGVDIIGTLKRHILNVSHIYKRGQLKSNWYKNDYRIEPDMKIEDQNIIKELI